MPDRRYYDTLDDAMAAPGVPVESRALARDLTAKVPSEIWIPAKSTYIAMRPQGERVVKTYVNRGFVDWWDARRYERTHIVGGIADGPTRADRRRPSRLVDPRSANSRGAGV